MCPRALLTLGFPPQVSLETRLAPECHDCPPPAQSTALAFSPISQLSAAISEAHPLSSLVFTQVAHFVLILP